MKNTCSKNNSLEMNAKTARYRGSKMHFSTKYFCKTLHTNL